MDALSNSQRHMVEKSMPENNEDRSCQDSQGARFARTAARILNLIGHRCSTEPRPSSLPEATELRSFRYRRIGYDERRLELLAGGVTGRGRADFERWWRIDEQGRLVIGGHPGAACRLVLGDDGVWRGRWLNFERMDIELRPTVYEGTSSVNTSEPRESIDAVFRSKTYVSKRTFDCQDKTGKHVNSHEHPHSGGLEERP